MRTLNRNTQSGLFRQLDEDEQKAFEDAGRAALEDAMKEGGTVEVNAVHGSKTQDARGGHPREGSAHGRRTFVAYGLELSVNLVGILCSREVRRASAPQSPVR